MTLIRTLAVKISNALVRFVPPASQDWANAISAELPSIENDWAALFWALGGMKVLFVRRSVHVASLSDVSAAASAFAEKIRKRTVAGIVINLYLVWAFTRMLLHMSSPLQRAGCVLVVVAVLFFLIQVIIGRGISIPRDIDLSERARLYRIELERQRNFFSGAWLWSRVVVMLPGYVMLCVGGAIAHPETVFRQTTLLAVFVALLIVAVQRSHKMATNFARQISELDEIQDKK